jgi:hypothetical protein
MDLCWRRIIGWTMDPRAEHQLVVAAIPMALGYRKPSVSLLLSRAAAH